MGEHKKLPKRPSEKEFAREKKREKEKTSGERQLLKLDLEDESVFFKLLSGSKISFLSKVLLAGRRCCRYDANARKDSCSLEEGSSRTMDVHVREFVKNFRCC